MADVDKNVTLSWELAKSLRAPWHSRWQRLLELALPYRTSFHGGGNERFGMPLAPIYDDTALVGIEEMANRLQSGIFPAGVEWAAFEADEGSSPDLKTGLLAVQREVFSQLHRSNFAEEITDVLKDTAAWGNYGMRVRGGDWSAPLLFQAIPLANMWITPGANGRWADIHVAYRLPAYAVKASWQGGVMPESLASDGRRQETVTVIDSWVRDLNSPTERWLQQVHLEGKHPLLTKEHKGAGCCEYVFGRWSKAAGELYGVGQGMMLLPTIETANQMERLRLSLGELALSGMWQAEDDGVLNPYSVKLEPGTIIPIAPGSKGLQPIQSPGLQADLGLMELRDKRQAIRKGLYNEQLGPREGTPPTAFEIQQRMDELRRQIGPAYFRIWSEFAVPLLARVRYVMQEQGRIVMPVIDGRKVKLVSASSMVKAQGMVRMQATKALMTDIAQMYGPQALASLIPPDRFHALGMDAYDVPPEVAFTHEEQVANSKQQGELAGQMAADPKLAGMLPAMMKQ